VCWLFGEGTLNLPLLSPYPRPKSHDNNRRHCFEDRIVLQAAAWGGLAPRNYGDIAWTAPPSNDA